LIKGFPRTTTTTTTTKQNVDPAVYYVYSRVKIRQIGRSRIWLHWHTGTEIGEGHFSVKKNVPKTIKFFYIANMEVFTKD
jgi:hypothetical protein